MGWADVQLTHTAPAPTLHHNYHRHHHHKLPHKRCRFSKRPKVYESTRAKKNKNL